MMRSANGRLTRCLVVLALLLVTVRNANAYIDPGTGSYLLQIFAASVIGALFVIKCFWRNIVQGVSRIVKKKK